MTVCYFADNGAQQNSSVCQRCFVAIPELTGKLSEGRSDERTPFCLFQADVIPAGGGEMERKCKSFDWWRAFLRPEKELQLVKLFVHQFAKTLRRDGCSKWTQLTVDALPYVALLFIR